MAVKNHALRITDIEEIKELYEKGIISSTTYWRARKRGWCSPYWQKKQLTSSATEEEVYRLIENIYESVHKKAIHLYSIYGRRGDWSVCDDMAHDALLHLIEKKEVKYPLIVAGSYMRHYLISGRYK